ncbi:MAG: hypothetical protein WCW52_04625 [Elusimicrobiales bacterium]|jgi:hypothetical protein
MKKEELRKAWLAAAVTTVAVISAIFIYAAVVEIIGRAAYFKAPVSGAAAAAVKYALYFLGTGSVFSLKFIRPAMEARRGTAAEALSALVKEAAVTAAICEVPAFAGFVLFFLTGGRWDFYLLASFSTVMQLFFFPRYPVWEEKLRAEYGLDG